MNGCRSDPQRLIHPQSLRSKRRPKLDENYDEQEVGAVADGWTERFGVTTRITNSNSIHGFNSMLVTVPAGTSQINAYKALPKVDSRFGFRVALKILDIGNDAFQIGLGSPDELDAEIGLIHIRFETNNTIDVYDGDKTGRGTWTRSGVTWSVGENVGVEVSNVDVNNYTWDVTLNNGSTRATVTGLGFQHSRNYITALFFHSRNPSTTQTIVMDYMWLDNPKAYSFGDSITRGTGYGDLNADGSDSYTMQYAANYDKVTRWTRNIDGGGSVGYINWGLAELPDRIASQEADAVLLAFGVHDAGALERYGTPDVDDYLRHYRHAILLCKDMKVEPIGWVMTRDTRRSIDVQRRMAYAAERLFIAEGVRYVNAWDATDQSPFNDQLDEAKLLNFHTDGVHPITAGHTMIAKQLARTFGLYDFKGSNYGTAFDTTDADGEITVAHGLTESPNYASVHLLGDNANGADVVRVDATNITVRVKDASEADVARTAVEVMWEAKV